MKKNIFFFIIFGLILACLSAEKVILNPAEEKAYTINIIEATDDFTTIEMVLNHYNKETINIDGNDYFNLFIPNGGNRLEAGNPELPIVAKSLMIPPNAKMHVEILETEYSDFAGHIAPSKGSFSRNINPADVPFTFSEIYQSYEYFPADLVQLNDPYIMREIRGISFHISPFTYNPTQGIVRNYHKITFKIYADGTDTINTMTARTSKLTADFIDIYENHFINYNQSNTRYTSITEEGAILVITHPSFTDAIQPYIDWKRQKGIHTEVVLTTDIAPNPTVAQIKAFISNRWQQSPNIAFVQLVGDAAQIPTLNVTVAGLGTGGSDPDYAMLLGSDYYPEIFIGRFSGTTTAEIATQVQRTIHYERDIDPSDTWLSHAVGIAGTDGGSGGHYGQSDIVHMNVIRNLLLSGTYTAVDQIYQPEATPAIISNAFNSGRGLANYISHGNITSWDFSGYGAMSYTSSHVNALTNSYQLPFIVAVACQNGNFVNYTCFAETWLRATHNTTGDPTGAIAYYGSSVDQPWQEPMYAQDHIAELLVAETKKTIGGLFFNGSSYMLDNTSSSPVLGVGTMRTWNIFGDASLMVRTKPPIDISVIAETIIEPSTTLYPVSTNAPGARVTLYNVTDGIIYATLIADGSGNATFDFTEPLDTDIELTLTITAFNRTTFTAPITITDNPPALVPYPAIDPIPTNNAEIYELAQTLSWSIDNEGEIPTGYQIFFGTASPPPQIEADWTTTSFILSDENTLEFGTIYYWQIVPFNENGDAVSCPIWSFSVASAPILTITPSTFDYGNITIGETSPMQTFALSNTGEATLIISSITSSGEHDFTIEDVTGVAWHVPSGGTMNLFIQFSPTQIGYQSTILTITHNTESGELGTLCHVEERNISEILHSVQDDKIVIPSAARNLEDVSFLNMTNIVIPSAARNLEDVSFLNMTNKEYSESTINYQLSTINSSRGFHQILLEGIGMPHLPEIAINLNPENNATNIPLDITLSWSQNEIGGDPTGYKLYFDISNPPTTLYTLGEETTWEPTLDLLYDTTYFWQIVPFNEAGDADGCPIWSFTTVAPPIFYISPQGYDFGSVLVGENSEQTFTITNIGGSQLIVEAISDCQTEDFVTEGINAFPTELGEGESMSFSVTFTPLTEGDKSDQISITNDASDSPYNLSLTGQGIAPPIFSITPGSRDFGSLFIGENSEQTFTITNIGGSPLIVETISDCQTEDFVTEGINAFPTELGEEESMSFSVTFTPLTEGDKSDQISITHNAEDSPFTLLLTGQAATPTFNPPQNVFVMIDELPASRNDVPLFIGWQAPEAGSSGTLSHYRVYKNGVFFEETYYHGVDDLVENDNIYTYSVYAVYIDLNGESEPTEGSITLSPLNPPQNLQATAEANYINLSWEAPLSQQYGTLNEYYVYRYYDPEQTDPWLIATIPINETTYSDYTIDVNISYTYHIKAKYLDPEGVSEPSNYQTVSIIVSENDELEPLLETKLHGNYPNPFNPETNVKFSLAHESNLRIDIYNIKGQRIVALIDGYLPKGEHNITWNGKDDSGREVSSGIYFYVMRTQNYTEMKRMMLVK